MTAKAFVSSSTATIATQSSRCSRQLQPRVACPRARQTKVSASAIGALSSDSFGLSGGSSTGSLLSQAASVVGIGLAAWFAARVVDGPGDGADNSTECPRCEGTGEVECACTRWSDGDVGCASCRGSGRSPCPACGGGGTAVPVTAKIIARRDSSFRGQS